jgi:hypothetical protein
MGEGNVMAAEEIARDAVMSAWVVGENDFVAGSALVAAESGYPHG